MYTYYTSIYDKETYELIKNSKFTGAGGVAYWEIFMQEYHKNPNVFEKYYVIIACSSAGWVTQRYNAHVDDGAIGNWTLDYDKVDKSTYAILDKEYLRSSLKKI